MKDAHGPSWTTASIFFNQNSLPLAPTHSMQFGCTFQCLLQHLVYAYPTFGPPLLMKVNLTDGYYRAPLSPEAALELAVVLPLDANRENLIGLPCSPPYFCAFTETSADLANQFASLPQDLPPHPMEHQIQTLPFSQQHVYADSITLPSSQVPSTPCPMLTFISMTSSLQPDGLLLLGLAGLYSMLLMWYSVTPPLLCADKLSQLPNSSKVMLPGVIKNTSLAGISTPTP